MEGGLARPDPKRRPPTGAKATEDTASNSCSSSKQTHHSRTLPKGATFHNPRKSHNNTTIHHKFTSGPRTRGTCSSPRASNTSISKNTARTKAATSASQTRADRHTKAGKPHNTNNRGVTSKPSRTDRCQETQHSTSNRCKGTRKGCHREGPTRIPPNSRWRR